MRKSILAVMAILIASSISPAVDGIAVAHPDEGTPRDDMFGPVVRYDIKASKVVERTTIYAGGARCVCMSVTGDSGAFERQDGSNTWISSTSINGGTPRDMALS